MMMIGSDQVSGIAQLKVQQHRYSLPGGSDREHLETVAREFEALLIKQMLDTMRETLNPENRLADVNMAEEMFDDMLYDEYAQLMSKTGGFGLADMIVTQFTAQQRV